MVELVETTIFSAMVITYWTALYQKIIIALYYDLPVFKDVYQMTLKIFQITTNFTGDA